MKTTFLTAMAIAAIALSASAQMPMPMTMPAAPETISVSGTGRSTVVPDRIVFSAGVQTLAPTVDEAVNENNRKIAAVIAALKAAGADAKEIRTSNFTIYPQQDYQQGKMPRILGYQVSNTIIVSRGKAADPASVSMTSKLLQAAINAGVNVTSGLSFEVSDPRAGRDTGLRMAFEDARSKALLLAQAAGRSLGRALTISEGGQAMPPPGPRPMVMAMKAQAADVSEVPVEAGTQEASYTVSVVFELK